jgi:hypothetical protein
LLAPRDSDIRENLNYVRSELGLPVRDSAQNPGELLARVRDSLRPDEWFLAGAIWFCSFAVWAGVAVIRKGRWRPAVTIGLVGALAVVVISRQQVASSYRRGARAVVSSRQAVAYRNPSTEARKTEFLPVYGESIAVVEKRTSWSLIRSEGGEGWVQDADLTQVW